MIGLVAIAVCAAAALYALGAVRRLVGLATELAATGRELRAELREQKEETHVYGEAWCALVQTIIDSDKLSEYQAEEAIRRNIERVHDHVALRQEHREV